MKVSIVPAVVFDEMHIADEYSVYHFSSYRGKDYIHRSLEIKLDYEFHLYSIFMISDKYGYLQWNRVNGLCYPHVWRSPREIQSEKLLSAQLSSQILVELPSFQYAFNCIIPDILDNMKDYELAGDLTDVISGKRHHTQINWERTFRDYTLDETSYFCTDPIWTAF